MEFDDRETKDMLHQLYWNEKKSLRDISKELLIPLSTIMKDFGKFGIRTRTIRKAVKNHWIKRPRKVYE